MKLAAFGFTVGLALSPVLTASAGGGSSVRTLTDRSFEAEMVKPARPYLVDFYATWNAPSKEMASYAADMATEFAGEVTGGKLDTDANSKTRISVTESLSAHLSSEKGSGKPEPSGYGRMGASRG